MEGIFIPIHRPYSNLSEEDLNQIIKSFSYFRGTARKDAASELKLRRQILEQVNKKTKQFKNETTFITRND